MEKIKEIRDRVRADETFAARIRKKYSIKNTTGFSINPFIDYDDPCHIIINLMIGSEGALAFISEVVMRSVPTYKCKESSMVYFPDIMTACKATVALKKGPVDGAELLDRPALKSVENKEGIPDFIKDFDETTTAVLMEAMASDQDILAENIVQIKNILIDFTTLRSVEFTSNSAENEQLWNIRKGVFPAVGGMRAIGTTCIIEDVAYHMETLPEATKDLQDIMVEHGYSDAVIYGHALEGNFHFIINQDVNDPKEVKHYDAMMHAVINMIVDKYDGSLKAEHGTGRNMAPFVKKEWGENGDHRLLLYSKGHQSFCLMAITCEQRCQQTDKLILDLQEAMQKVKKLSSLVPICSHCRKNRDDKGYWEQIEQYIQDHSEADSAMVNIFPINLSRSI